MAKILLNLCLCLSLCLCLLCLCLLAISYYYKNYESFTVNQLSNHELREIMNIDIRKFLKKAIIACQNKKDKCDKYGNCCRKVKIEKKNNV